MSQPDLALMAHLMRRAGFGASRDELESYVSQGYESTIEQLLQPHKAPSDLEDEDIIRRYHVHQANLYPVPSCQTYWLRRMINTKRPLEEKVALFWHGVFATSFTKLFMGRAVLTQVDKFRRYGLGSFRTLLVELSRDPAMIFWLDNKDNHKDAVNENFGRELLELFAMGVGNYTEDDVRQASRAFTGWTVRDEPYFARRAERCSVWPYGDIEPQFHYDADDHDDGEKTFLGETGTFDGQEIVDIICQNPATARFIARHLYNFFVADEAQVPAWETVPPRDPEAIQGLVDAFVSSDYEIRAVLRFLFNSDFFKSAAFARVKSPAELVAGTARMVGGYESPKMDDIQLGLNTGYMGQALLNPVSVEGWHTGKEWISTSGLVARVNFAVGQFADLERPGVRSIVDRIRSSDVQSSPESLVDACLDMMGPMTVPELTRKELLEFAESGFDSPADAEADNGFLDQKIMKMLQLIVSTREFQMA